MQIQIRRSGQILPPIAIYSLVRFSTKFIVKDILGDDAELPAGLYWKYDGRNFSLDSPLPILKFELPLILYDGLEIEPFNQDQYEEALRRLNCAN